MLVLSGVNRVHHFTEVFQQIFLTFFVLTLSWTIIKFYCPKVFNKYINDNFRQFGTSAHMKVKIRTNRGK